MPSSQRIEDYALISNCAAGALVGRNGSIDWLCLPRFDSTACFAALLGEPEHGRWLIAPVDPAARVERHYSDASLILVTRFETTEGAVDLVDFINLWHGFSDLVRLVRGVRGRVSMRTEFILRFDYGAVVPWVERLPEGGISAIAGPERVLLRTPAPLPTRTGREPSYPGSHGTSHSASRRSPPTPYMICSWSGLPAPGGRPSSTSPVS
jgi:GH15 family glucan-1,4-alpha-glucosidase